MADAQQIPAANRIATAHAMIERYNAQDADGYVALMTEGACEATYRGAVLREGREGVRSGLKAIFAEFPGNRAEILTSYALGDTVVLHEKVARSPEAEPFEVMSIYSFSDDKVDRVEFIR
ncbi:nuclear transport factor 2 family protein [Sphingomonas sp. UNC305MFCol5.2]|uniref:nuclear transport factor 2 family protein n=1 Tax=Sphingomonas sp. UNC305MFCol5.2 TaxID=1449076 RepID=UPI000407EA35|nr:nuclear transport factor 2 family protein [Sphingomonas sp. UNC305MFCol5.2]